MPIYVIVLIIINIYVKNDKRTFQAKKKYIDINSKEELDKLREEIKKKEVEIKKKKKKIKKNKKL